MCLAGGFQRVWRAGSDCVGWIAEKAGVRLYRDRQEAYPSMLAFLMMMMMMLRVKCSLPRPGTMLGCLPRLQGRRGGHHRPQHALAHAAYP